MGPIAKICGIVAVFGALNWVALSWAGKDAVTLTLGPGPSPLSHALMAVVGLSAVFVLVQVVKPARAKKK